MPSRGIRSCDLGHRDPKHTVHYTRVAAGRFEGFGAESGRFRAQGDQTFRLLERWAFLANSSTSRYDKEKRKYHLRARRITSGSNSRHLNRPAIEGTSDIRPAYHLPTRKLQHSGYFDLSTFTIMPSA